MGHTTYAKEIRRKQDQTGNKKFKQFVSRALYLYSRCKVKKLFLNLCYNGYHSSRQMVDQWIQFVMTNEVTELEINFSNGILIGYDVTSKPYEFPYIQPTSKSLDDLEEQNHIFFDFEDDQYWQTQTSTFYCLEYCLKEVCVYSDFGRNLEMHMLRFLLENAKVLEKMFLYTHQKIRGQEVKQQLSNSQKASPIAKLFIFDL
ncbi:hypothetical protein RYX36_023347 [Vicia faba]